MTDLTPAQMQARIEQLEAALHLKISTEGRIVPPTPEPHLAYVAVTVQPFVMHGRMGQQNAHSAPVPVGTVTWKGNLPASHVAAGMGPPIPRGADGKPAVVLIQNDALELHDVVPAEQLSGVVAT